MRPYLPLLRQLTLGGMIGLLVALSIYQFSLPSGVNVTVFCLQALPLIILLPGIFQQRRRTYQWLGFVILLYFVRGVVGVLAPQVHWIDIAQLTLSLSIFLCSLLVSRELIASTSSAS